MKPLPTLRQLRYLVALADHRHFGKAAESCFATQSTLSAGLQELETLLGAILVERTKRRVMPTPLGEEVVARARALLRGAEDLVEAVEMARQPLTGALRLGIIPTIAPYLLPGVLPGLRAAHPRLRLMLREDLTMRLLDGLGGGALDAVLIALPWPAEGLETLELAEDPFLFACAPDHPLAAKDSVTSADLAATELLLLEDGHCLREHALSACRLPSAAGRAMGTSLNTLVQMVANGLGVTLLPKLAVDGGVLRGTDLVTRPLAEPASRRIGLAWRRSSPRAAEFALLGEALKGTEPAPTR
ncbi:MAG: hydrogen peroxide-inducible genes activator [Alphaproteobacteria bacterium]|nr:hydrogen peroxide-inducible genes activator [Alphaproteobacteria bacterium]